MGSITPVYVFILKKGMKFTFKGKKGVCLEETSPYRTVRMYTDMEPSELWIYEKVRLI